MKIAIVIDHLKSDRAGTENQVAKLIRGLGLRHDILLVCLLSSPWVESGEHGMPCRAVVLRHDKLLSFSRLRELATVVGTLREFRPDVVHTFFPISNSLGVLLARVAGCGTIIASRRDFGIWMSKRYLAATRFANRYVDWIVTNSDRVRDLTVECEGFPRARVAVIPNAVDLEGLIQSSVDSTLRLRLGIPPIHRVIGHVANFRLIKRQDTLIRALAIILQTRADVTVVFAGERDDEMFPQVQQLVEELGLAAHVVFTVAESDIGEYLALFDVGVNSSETEGLSNAVIEYMTASVPVVATNGGGNADLVTHDVTGLVFEAGDEQTLAAHLLLLMSAPDLRYRLAKSARAFVENSMAIESVLARFEALYSAVAKSALTVNAGRLSRAVPVVRAAGKKAVISAITAPYLLTQRRVQAQQAVTVLMYHEIGTDEDSREAWTVVRRSDFLRQLDYVQRHYDILPLAAALDRVATGRWASRPAVVLTFDDGCLGDVDRLLPIVRSRDVPVSIFVSTGHIQSQTNLWFNRVINSLPAVGAYQVDLSRFGLRRFVVNNGNARRRWAEIQSVLEGMKSLPIEVCDAAAAEVELQLAAIKSRQLPVMPLTLEGLRELASCSLVDLGAHTHGHEILTIADPTFAEQSIARSRELLREWTGRSIPHFSYPSGVFNPAVREIVQRLGFSAALGTEHARWNSPDQRFAIPRIPIGRFDSMEVFQYAMNYGMSPSRAARMPLPA